jgi:methionyl-tRNA formyltransferase
VIVVSAFGQILRQEVLELPSFGCLNVHASLLPRWRGAAPINAAILHGDKETGVTIMKMDAGLDTGPILSQRAVRIEPYETAGSLFEKLSGLGAGLLLETLPGYLAGQIEPRPQPEEGVTYAPMLKKEDGQLDFSRPAEELERKIRAFNPWPGTYFEWDGNLLKVHRASIGVGTLRKGQKTVYMGLPAVGTSHGLLVLVEVQPAGKKPMGGKAFLAGAREWKEDEYATR